MSVRHHFYLFVFALTTIHSGWAQSGPASDRNNPNGQEQRPTSDSQMPGMDHRPMPGMHMNMTQTPATFITNFASQHVRNQRRAELHPDAHAHDKERPVDADVPWCRIFKCDAAERAARRRQSIFYELVHAYGAETARSWNTDAANDGQPGASHYHRALLPGTVSARRDGVWEADRRWSTPARFHHGVGRTLRREAR